MVGWDFVSVRWWCEMDDNQQLMDRSQVCALVSKLTVTDYRLAHGNIGSYKRRHRTLGKEWPINYKVLKCEGVPHGLTLRGHRPSSLTLPRQRFSARPTAGWYGYPKKIGFQIKINKLMHQLWERQSSNIQWWPLEENEIFEKNFVKTHHLFWGRILAVIGKLTMSRTTKSPCSSFLLV